MEKSDVILENSEQFDQLSDQFSELEKDLEDLTGKKEFSTSAILGSEEEHEEDKTYYFLVSPEKDAANVDVFRIFNKMTEVVQGQLIASVYNLSDNSTLLQQYQPGNNIAVSPDGKQFFAAAAGQVTWWGNSVSIEKLKKINGDISPLIGEQRYNETIVVNGNITDDVKIHINGDLFVTENIGKAEVEVSGNIYVKNGIRGRSGGKVTAKGNIFAKFIENSNVSSHGSIIVNDAIMHSKTSAENKIIINGKLKRLIVGGVTCAGEEVASGVIGSETYTVTEIVIGLLGNEKEELNKLTEKKHEYQRRIQQLDLDISKLVTLKSEGKFTDAQAKRLDELKEEKKQLTADSHNASKKIEYIDNKLNSRKSGCVSASEIIYPGVKLNINNVLGPINSSIKRCSAAAKKGELSFIEYKQPQIPLDDNDFIKHRPQSKPLTFSEAKIVRKSIIIIENSEESAVAKGMELLNLSKDNMVYTVLEYSGIGRSARYKIRMVEVKEGENPKKIKQKITPFDKNKSVVVEGETVEDCLKKVSSYFRVPVERLNYTILQQKATGILGVGKKIFQLKVSMKSESDESKQIQKDSIVTTFENDMDGYFTLQNTDDGLILTVYPPRGQGKKVDEQDVIKEINLYGYKKDINLEAASEAVKNAAGIINKIGPRQPEPELDGKFEIKVADDKLSASIIMYPPEPGGKYVAKETVMNKIAESGIKHFKEEEIDRVFNEFIYAEEVIFAQGKNKVDGKDAALDFKINISDEKILNFKEDDAGKVDFHEMGLIENVMAGQTLARKIPASIGENGEDIFGTVITASDGNDIQLTPGKNVSLSDDGMEMISDIDGFVAYDGKKLRVDPIYHVNGDVSFETGNITFLGAVIVTGTVRDDFVIRASGDVFVGSVAAAEIEAEGNVVIRGGVSGRDKAQIKAGGSVISKFVEQANISAGKHVVVQEAIMHSNISAGGSIVCLEGKRGLIVGGTIRAGEEIYCKELGSKIATRTFVEVGIDPAVRQSIIELETKLREQKENFDRVRKGIKALSMLKKKVGVLPPQKESLLLELVGLNRVLNTKLQSIQQELKTLQTKMRESGKGKVCVLNQVYTGIKIVVKNAIVHIDQEMTFSKFFYENGEVRIGQYEEPPTKLMEQLKTEIKEPRK